MHNISLYFLYSMHLVVCPSFLASILPSVDISIIWPCHSSLSDCCRSCHFHSALPSAQLKEPSTLEYAVCACANCICHVNYLVEHSSKWSCQHSEIVRIVAEYRHRYMCGYIIAVQKYCNISVQMCRYIYLQRATRCFHLSYSRVDCIGSGKLYGRLGSRHSCCQSWETWDGICFLLWISTSQPCVGTQHCSDCE